MSNEQIKNILAAALSGETATQTAMPVPASREIVTNKPPKVAFHQLCVWCVRLRTGKLILGAVSFLPTAIGRADRKPHQFFAEGSWRDNSACGFFYLCRQLCGCADKVRKREIEMLCDREDYLIHKHNLLSLALPDEILNMRFAVQLQFQLKGFDVTACAEQRGFVFGALLRVLLRFWRADLSS